MPRLIISLVQSINGSFAQDGWSSGVSTDTDFRSFIALRRQANAIIVDRRTALNPRLPVINAAGKTLEHTPVHVLTESDAEPLAKELNERGLDYRARQFTPDTLTEVLAGLETTPPSESGQPLLLCESGPNLGFRLLDSSPGAELHLSLSPRYLNTSGSHFSQLSADIGLRVIDVRSEDDQVFIRYAKA